MTNLAVQLADLDAAEDLIDAWITDGDFATGDRIVRAGSDVSVLIVDSLPGHAAGASLVFCREDGHLYRFVDEVWTAEGELVSRSSANRTKEIPTT